MNSPNPGGTGNPERRTRSTPARGAGEGLGCRMLDEALAVTRRALKKAGRDV